MKQTPIFRRLAAFIIDHLIMVSLLALIGLIFADPLKESAPTLMESAKELLNKTIELFPGKDPSLASKIAEKFSFYFTHMKSTVFICGALYFLYFVYFERSKWQGTIGKKLLSLKVSDNKNKRLSALKAAKRFIIFAAPSLFMHVLVLFMYPECVEARSNFMKSGIEFPTPCVALFVVYAISYTIWLIPIFFTANRATTYDMLSDTKVTHKL